MDYGVFFNFLYATEFGIRLRHAMYKDNERVKRKTSPSVFSLLFDMSLRGWGERAVPRLVFTLCSSKSPLSRSTYALCTYNSCPSRRWPAPFYSSRFFWPSTRRSTAARSRESLTRSANLSLTWRVQSQKMKADYYRYIAESHEGDDNKRRPSMLAWLTGGLRSLSRRTWP